MNNITSNILTIGRECTIVSTVSFIIIIYNYFAPRSTSNFLLQFPRINIFTSTSIRKCHECLEINCVWFVLAQLHPKNAMSQPPFYKIDYSGSYRPFLFRKLQLIKYKTCTSYYSIEWYILQKTKPVAPLSTASSTGHFEYLLYAYI